MRQLVSCKVNGTWYSEKNQLFDHVKNSVKVKRDIFVQGKNREYNVVTRIPSACFKFLLSLD